MHSIPVKPYMQQDELQVIWLIIYWATSHYGSSSSCLLSQILYFIKAHVKDEEAKLEESRPTAGSNSHY